MALPELDVILDFVGLSGALLLFIVSILIVYPLFAYARNVAYTEGLFLLAFGFFAVTLITVFEVLLHMDAAADALRVPAGIAALFGTWFFARDFVDVDRDDTFGLPPSGGGDVDDDDR